MQLATAAKRYLRKLGKDREAAALSTIVVGGVFCESMLATRRFFDRCSGQVVETIDHRYWSCPANARLHDPDGLIANGQAAARQLPANE